MCFENLPCKDLYSGKNGVWNGSWTSEIRSKPQPLLQKTCLSYASKTLAAYAGCDPRTQAKGYLGHFISKNRFFSHLKGFIFHFNTP